MVQDPTVPAGPVAAPAAAPLRPTAGFAFRHPLHTVALGFGSGLSPVAPGTVGTLWAWLAFVLVEREWTHGAPWGWILLVGTALGVWAATVTARDLRQPDPSAIVWDEVLAFWLVLWLVTPASPWTQLVAFALFRYFDAAKPGPVRWADQRYKSTDGRIGWRQGFGVLFDDFVAAGCTLMVMALWRAVSG